MSRAEEASILIVDDMPKNLRLLSQALEERGYRVRIANSGQRALAAVASNPPDLILLDIMMPGMSGYEVCKQLKSREDARAIPVIYISALSSEEDKVSAFAAGAVDYVTKPFQFEEVLARVETHLSIRILQKNLQAEKQKSDDLLLEIIPKLRESEARFRAVLEHSRDGVVLLSAERKISYVSPAYQQLLGFASEELVGHFGTDYIHPEDREFTAHKFAKLLQTPGGTIVCEYRLQRKDGSYTWIETTAVNLLDDPNVQTIVLNQRDINERKRAEIQTRLIAEVQDALLRPCELKDIYRLVSEKVNQLIGDGVTATSIMDEKRKTLRMGYYHGVDIPIEKVLAVIGFDPWRKEFPLDAMAEEDLIIYRSSKLGILEGGLYALMTRLVPKPACQIVEKLLRVQKIYGMGFVHKEAHLGGLVILARSDITPHIAAIEQIVNLAAIAIERNLAEEAVKNNNRRFEALITHGRDEISLLAADGTLLWESPSVHSTLGYAPNQFMGENIFRLMHPDDREWTSILFAQVVQTPNGVQEGEFRLLHADGAWHWIECSATNLLDEPGVHAIVLNYRDITERKQAEEKIARSEKKYRELFEVNKDGIAIFLLDMNGAAPSAFIELNDAAPKMLGYTREEMLTFTPALLEPHTTREQLQSRQAELEARGIANFETVLAHKNGQAIFTEFTAQLIEYEGKPAVMNIVRDITERKRAESVLEARLRLAEFAATNSLAALQQKALDELCALSKSPIGFFHYVAPDEKTLTLQAWSTRTLEEMCQTEGKGRHYDIEQAGVWVDCVRQRKPVIHNDYASLPAARRKGLPKGHATIVREVVLPIVRDQKMVAIIGVGNKPADYTEDDVIYLSRLADLVWDITVHKQAEEEIRQLNASLEQRVEERTRELREAQKQLVQHEKLAAMGQLAGSMGHELRNPLGVISNAIYFLKMTQSDAGSKTKEYLDLIEKQIRVSNKIITDLLDFTSVKPLERVSASVSELIRQTLHHFPAPNSVKVTLDLPADLPKVYVSSKYVVQILDNLTLNAYQAMEEHGGSLTFTARVRGDMLYIAVRDTGKGVPSENADKIFEPLFSTKLQGIGLGLAISKKLAEANDGRIEVESEVEKGSTFTVWLPVSQSVL